MTDQAVPGPKGHFLIGNLPEMARNPAAWLLAVATEFGDIAHFRLLNTDIYLVANPDYIHEVLVAQRDRFHKADVDRDILSKFLGNGILLSEGHYHRRQRKLVQPAFHATRVQAYAGTMVDYTLRLLDSWSDGDEQPIDEAMRRLTMEIVAKTLFDADVSGQAGVVGEAMAVLQRVSNYDFRTQNAIPDWLPLPRNLRRRRASRVLDEVVNGIINQRRTTSEDRGDLLSMLLLSEDERGERMNDAEVRDEAVTLFAAGHETTSNALTWTWYALSQNPAVRDQLRAEVDRVLGERRVTLDDLPNLVYTTMVIKESLRLYPPVWVLNGRQALVDVSIDGYRIPAGSTVFVAPYALHRNPRYFDDPLTFDPQRFSPENEPDIPRYTYFPFGGGPRVCIGNSFALMEMQLILPTIIQRFILDLMPDQAVDIEPLVTMGPRYGMRMRLTARQAEA